MDVLILLAALIAGFVALVIAGDALVTGATALARRIGVPPLLVALTIVAFGTSAPELFVGVQAVLSGAPKLALGNIVGSNIANTLLVIGLPALIAPIACGSPGLRRNATIALAAGGLFIALSLDRAFSLTDGLILLAALTAYLAFQGYRAYSTSNGPPPDIAAEVESVAHAGEGSPWPMIILRLVGGLIGLPIGAALIVHGGVGLAEYLNVPNEIVGLTVVAFGTSLPELATAIMAAIRRHAEVILGSVMGSNVFNVLAVGGASSVAGTVPVSDQFFAYDYWIFGASAVALLLFVIRGRDIGRLLGGGLFLAYVAYIVGLAILGRGGAI